ncbi:MAG: fibronectin type III domain-containing protein [Candidatus Nanopelagicales bacterium]|nr:fibronectin type III domain-containing protein [Candidatus Nanopelagicales bacterium]
MKRGFGGSIKTGLLAATVFSTALALAAPAAATIGEPVADSSGAIFRDAEWVTGSTNYAYLYGNAYAGAVMHAPAQPAPAGEVFYVHAEAALIWNGVTNDVVGMTLALPEGVTVSPSAATPVRCFITGTRSNAVPTRQTGECLANPSPSSGVQIPLGAITMFTGGPSVGGEIAHVFVPVISSRAVNGENVFVTVSVSDPAASPRDIVGDAPLTVAPGNPQTGGGALAAPSGKSFTWKGKRKAVVTWSPVPGAVGYRARLKVGTKWTKWSNLSDNGLKLTKLKRGKRYILQVQAVGDTGRGAISTWRFKTKR